MSYNNPSGEATYTYAGTDALIVTPTTSGLIASSAGDTSQYYAQTLAITSGATVSGATVGDQGVLKTNGSANQITVLSGGLLSRTGNTYKNFANLTVMSGGTALGFNGGQAYWSGTWNIQSGANMFGFTDVYTDPDGHFNYAWHVHNGGALNPYIKIRNIDIATYLYVRGGGVSGAIVRGGATAANNAYLHLLAAGLSAYDVHVLSGGSIYCTGANVKFFDIVGDEGARMTFQANNSIGGQKTTFAKGFWTNVGMPDAYAEQGTIYNWTKPSTGAAFYFYDITLDTVDATAQYMYLGNGATVRNATIGGTTGDLTGVVLGQAGQGSAVNVTATAAGGGITVQSGYQAVFGGTENNVTAGHVLLGGAGAGVANPDLSIIGNEFNGIVLKTNSTKEYLVNVAIVEGLNAKDAVVSSGGSLTIAEGGSATGAVVSANGTFKVLGGGWASNATIAGTGNVSEGGQLSGAVLNAGTLNFYKTGFISGAVINGGTFRGYQGGTVSGATINGGYFYLMDGNSTPDRPTILANDIDVRGGSMFVRGSNALATNIRISAGDGNHYIQNHGRVSGATMTGGSLVMNINTGAQPVDGNPQAAYLDDVTVAGGTIHAGNYAKVTNARVAGGTLNVSNGATLTGATLTAGRLNVETGGKVYNLTVDGAGATDILHLTGNAYVSGAVVSGTGAGTNYVYMYDTAVMENVTADHGGIYGVSGGILRDLTMIDQAVVIMRGNAPYVSGAKVRSGKIHFQNGAKGDNLVVDGGDVSIINNGYGWNISTGIHGSGAKVSGADIIKGNVALDAGGLLYDARISGGTVGLTNNAGFGTTTISGAVVTGGKLNLWANTLGQAITVGENGAARVAGTMEVKTSAWNVQVDNGGTLKAVEGDTLTNLNALTGATVDYANGAHTSGAMIRGGETNIAANTLVYSGAVLDAQVVNGVMTNLGNNGNYYRMRVGEGITVKDAVVGNGHRLYAHENAIVQGGTINTGGNIGILGNAVGSGVKSYAAYNIFENGTAKDTSVENGGSLRLNASTAKAVGTVVKSGGRLYFADGAAGLIDDTTLKAGAKLDLISDVDTGDRLTLDFTGTTGNQSVTINDLGAINDKTEIVLTGVTAGNTYTFATTGATDKYVTCYADMGLYSGSIKAGETIENIFLGTDIYSFNAAGTAITVTQGATMTDLATAGSISNGTVLANGGRAAKWTNNTTAEAGATYTVATNDISNEVWLEIDGTNLAGTTLFGAADEFYSGVINLYATGGAVIGNLAAGAVAGGDIESVKLTIDSATVGLTYAGGFGAVQGAVETLIEGGTFQKDFYAGALVNHKNTGYSTGVGSISFTINGGEFSGNIYGASAVKSGNATSHVGGVGDVDITITGGETKRGSQACIFAGGYATGTTLTSNASVYEVGNINLSIDGGNWGTAAGGRGVFGGIFASGVRAETENVNITIYDGTMGNVYGGGWAQKGGSSIVGNVNISIEGGTIANVFGGGSHSTSGGTTEAGDVTITVSGGNITNAIYARGQLAGDATGDADVIFTGANDYSCSVYGYSYVGSSEATLLFSDYTGTLAGAIGGFANISLEGDTALELTSGDISNTFWTLDLTDRDASFAGTSLVNWSTPNSSFNGATLEVSFADADQAAAGWCIAEASNFQGALFDLSIGGTDIQTLGYEEMIVDTESQWYHWGFRADSDNTLRFCQLG